MFCVFGWARWTAAVALLAAPLGASAQDALPADPPLDPAIAASLGEESTELRELRLAEVEMFGPGTTLLEDGSLALEPPSLFTSDAPPAPPEVAEGGRTLEHLQGIALPDIPVRWDARVIRFLEFFQHDPRGHALMDAWLRRANRYGAVVRARLEEQGLPADLLHVAMIESGFDPLARSHAGAVGMWQFVSRTGTEYGLRQDRWIDERQSPERATDAGGRFLRDLYRRLGTWELALAAYNMGYGALLRAIRKYNSNDYWLLAELEAGLPFETTIYVSKIMACAIIGRNPERFGFAEVVPDPPIAFDRVRVPGGTAVGQIARAASSTPEEIGALNPELLRNRTPPDLELEVRIPLGRAEEFARAFARGRSAIPAHRAYVVRFGEDLARVAERHRTSPAALRTLNDLRETEGVGPGETILVPAVELATPEGDEGLAAAVPDRVFTYPDRRRVFYRVTSGDALDEIARFFEVRASDVMLWNHLADGGVLQRGMMLQLFVPQSVDLTRAVVFTPDDVRVLVVGSEEFFEHHESQQGRVRFRYRVREGDTTASIAERFELSVGSVARINRFSERNEVVAGDTVIIYAPRERVPREYLREIDRGGRPTPRIAPAPEDTEDSAEDPAPHEGEGEDVAQSPPEDQAEPPPP